MILSFLRIKCTSTVRRAPFQEIEIISFRSIYLDKRVYRKLTNQLRHIIRPMREPRKPFLFRAISSDNFVVSRKGFSVNEDRSFYQTALSTGFLLMSPSFRKLPVSLSFSSTYPFSVQFSVFRQPSHRKLSSSLFLVHLLSTYLPFPLWTRIRYSRLYSLDRPWISFFSTLEPFREAKIRGIVCYRRFRPSSSHHILARRAFVSMVDCGVSTCTILTSRQVLRANRGVRNY